MKNRYVNDRPRIPKRPFAVVPQANYVSTSQENPYYCSQGDTLVLHRDVNVDQPSPKPATSTNSSENTNNCSSTNHGTSGDIAQRSSLHTAVAVEDSSSETAELSHVTSTTPVYGKVERVHKNKGKFSTMDTSDKNKSTFPAAENTRAASKDRIPEIRITRTSSIEEESAIESGETREQVVEGFPPAPTCREQHDIWKGKSNIVHIYFRGTQSERTMNKS